MDDHNSPSPPSPTTMDPEVFRYIFHHVVFPPKLPGEPERRQKLLESGMMRFVKDTLASFVKTRPPDIQEKWKSAVNMLELWISVDAGGDDLNRHQDLLMRHIKNLKIHGAVALYVCAQNCGWLAHYDSARDNVIIDAFEVTATSAAILKATGPLIRCFPGQSVVISASMINETAFCKYLAHNLCRLNLESVREMCPKATQSRDCIEEIRDTVDPGLVTEGLMSQLLAFGEHNVWKSFEKHMRDEVIYDDTKLPWRRSPLWFVMKVALQTILYRIFPDNEGHAEYKNYMLYLAVMIGEEAQNLELPNIADILAISRAKVARRTYKLQGKTFETVMKRVMETDEAILQHLQQLRARVQTPESMAISHSFGPLQECDLEASLKHSREYIDNAMKSRTPDNCSSSFNKKHKQRRGRQTSGLPKIEDDEILSLLDFEAWVDTELQEWHAKTSPTEKVCCDLADLIEKYSEFASKKYAQMPDASSPMLLVLLELWVALDSLCVRLCPILKDYSPELSKKLVEPLLLPLFHQMQRARQVEDYIRSRQPHGSSLKSIFSDPGPDTFAVRYVDKNRKHKKVLESIENLATQKREALRKEWEGRSKEYQDLISQASNLTHDSVLDEWENEAHSTSCDKCDLETKAQKLTIQVHEWPLPNDEDKAKNIAFELDCPRWFAKWRDITWKIVDDYGRPQARVPSRMEMNILEYPATQTFVTKLGQRLTLASSTKSWLNTHYKTQNFPVTFDTIAVSNAFHFSLWDTEREVWVAGRFKLQKYPTFNHLCTLTLNDPKYSGLQYAVESCQHHQNKVLADQRNCPPKITLQEMSAFSHLRAGERLQWYNITRELVSPSFSMNESSVHKLLCQAAWELGSHGSGTQLGEAHAFFEELASVNRLLESLEHRLSTISTNWNEHYTLHTVVILGARILSLCPTSTVERASSFLRRCRKVAIDWCTRIKTALDGKIGAENDSRLSLLFKLGAICLLTFSVEDRHLRRVLESEEDLQFLVRSSIVLFENTPGPIESQSLETRALVLHGTRVLCNAEKQVSQLIIKHPSALNVAIQQTANNLQFSSPWCFAPGDNQRWAINRSVLTTDGDRQEVHYNILSGELLVNNERPKRLPDEYTRHPLFQRLFGSQTISVVSCRKKGTRFASTQRFGNYIVYFRLEGDQLVVKTMAEDHALRLIPHDVLAEDFPDSLITKFAHWLDLKTGEIEFRPLDQAWEPNPKNWRTSYKHQNGEIPRTKQGQRVLVDVHSGLFEQVSNILSRLDHLKHIQITSTQDSRIEAKLVRLHLSFFVNADGALECREHNAIVDQDQDIGCLSSLFSKLVLRGKTGQGHRTVLIPYGMVRISKEALYSQVSIYPLGGSRVKYFHYLFDPTLGMLSDTSGMVGALYQAYLHAVTTYVLPDAATNRSGTEEALRILRQARMKSSFPLDSDCSHLLELIASLTPRRQYHPPGMEVMQRVIWNPQMGELAQHDDFRVITQDIFNHTAKFAALHSSKKELPSGLDRGDTHLLDRARHYNSRFNRSEFANNSTGLDIRYLGEPMQSEYKARDRHCCVSDRSRRVYETAALIRDWPSNASQKETLLNMVKAWGNIYMRILTPDQHTYTSLMDSQIQHLWSSLYSQCRSSNRESGTYKLISVFCTIAFGNSVPTWQLRHLLTIAFSGYFPEIPQQLLQGPVQLGLAPGEDIDRSKVKEEISNNYPPQKPNPRGNMKSLSKPEKEKRRREQKKKYVETKKQEIEALASQITRQWPCEVLQRPTNMEPWQVKSLNASDILFKGFNRNVQFHQFIELVQQKLDAVPTSPLPDLLPIPPALPQCRPLICARSNPWQSPSLQDMLRSSNAPLPMDIDQTPLRCQRPQVPASSDRGPIDNLQSLIVGLRRSTKNMRRQYAHTLSDSLKALNKVHLPCVSAGLPVERDILVQHHKRAIEQRDSLWGQIVLALTTVDSSWKAIGGAVFWPSITVLSMLSFLAADKWDSVPPLWKDTLLMFAKVIVSLRRYERLLEHFDKEDVNTFYKEAETVGCEGWEASRIPDWLLLEIEGNMTIRERQANVAQRMIAPESKENCVLQLNMGEGKTTIITPMIAACLANGAQMVRIVVLKPLLRQSINLLSQRLGGLLNRPIYYVPFSRNTRIDKNTIETLLATYSECQQKRGILIVLPEQLLSFRLVGLDLAPSDSALGLVDIEQSLQDSCRTIIDESDEILDPKFQLIYTRGNQQNVDGGSDRWAIIQYVLELVEKQVKALQSEDQMSLDIEHRGIRYPLIHFLSKDSPDRLLQRVTEAISRGELPGVSFTEWAEATQTSVLNFITRLETNNTDERVVQNTFKDSIILKKLLVLRGLFAHGILRFVLASKRWLVDYGVHPSRCLSAVPFRAKGVPSENAEFGHADVALILTCLSYYYEGLTEEQVRQCFYFLMKENDPGAEYQRWITRNRDGLPEGLHSFNGVNLEDDHIFQRVLYQHLQYQKGIIDFFLAKIVFPKEAKGFPFKLSLSAWDIPSKPAQPLTTGFSGTNDNRYLLPKSMPQKDLPYLLHTNAMVLSQLLHEDNKQCILAEDKDGRQLPVNGLLHLINDQDPHIKVIIDVGALILESSNEEVAKTWLSIVPADRARAAIYFDANDEAMVVDREGYGERLIASPFYDRLHLCLVFLDQHHARGVDIKLPRTYRGAVTLGPRLTKDRLVQACNRMRELTNGQSVAFFIPPEVRHNMKKDGVGITSTDVVQWVLEQTCDQLEKLQPLWAWQGLQHFRCAQIWDDFRTRASSLEDIVARIQQPELKSLSQLYAPWGEHPQSIASLREIVPHDPTVRELLEKWEGVASTQTTLYEEQERELTQEIQREPQIRRPPSVEAQSHIVHADIKHFVKHGQFPRWISSDDVDPAFKCLSQTSARAFELPTSIGPHIYASLDFLSTIRQDDNTVDDEFLKPVHWVLSSTAIQTLVIISQHEANYLIPSIRKSKKATLHMYAPRTAKDMCSFSKLDFLTVGQPRPHLPVSPEAIRDLEIFSGSLYFDSFVEYQSACQFFGFKTDKLLDIPQDAITSEGFVSKEARTQAQWPVHCPFTTSPLPFLKAWYSIRTKGQGFSQSHIGSIVEARRLTEDRF